MVDWLIYTSLLMSIIFSLFSYCLGPPLWCVFAKEKEQNDAFSGALTLANLHESGCFHSAYPFEECSHHLHHRWRQSQALQRYRSHLHLCASRWPASTVRKPLANIGIVPLLLATASISLEKLFSAKEWYDTKVLQFLASKKSKKSKSRVIQGASTHPS